MADGYDRRQSEDGLWEVYDIGNDEVVIVSGIRLSGLDEDEAADAVDQLNSREITPDNPETP